MIYSNQQVTAASLPRLEMLNYERLNPLYASYVLWRSALSYACLATLIIVLSLLRPHLFPELTVTGHVAPILIGIVVVTATLCWFGLPYFSATKKKFAAREHDLVFRQGIWWHTETIQPYRRLQHLEIRQGPLEKRFGLASVLVYSAGSAMTTFQIPGLDTEKAHAIRKYALDYQQQNQIQLSGDSVAQKD